MSQVAVIRLVKSLSRVEKRQFKLATKKQTGTKEYLDLFEIIDRRIGAEPTGIREAFARMHPGSSIDNASRYLLRVLTDCLIQSKLKDDISFQLMHGMMRTRLLQERSLREESRKELKKLRSLAESSENDFFQYLLYRQELDYISDNDFEHLSEKHLIEMQMESREVLKDLRNIHEHHSLYELLKYRLVHSGKILSEEKKKKLNDLILSEMGLVTGRTKSSYQSRKLHLLFQSYFFTDIGDYRSAMKTFSELNKLFEHHRNLWNHPPTDYLSALDGILDSLRTIGYHEDTPFYLDKLALLDDPAYPEYFRFMVRKTELIYRIARLIGQGKHAEAVAFIDTLDAAQLKAYGQVDDEKQMELQLSLSMAYFGVRRFKKAQKHLSGIVITGKPSYQSVVYRVSLLLNILIDYETDNHDVMEYEIRSYKRMFQPGALKIEKLIFKTIQTHPDIKTPQKNSLLWKKMEPLARAIEKDKFESQLHKYFDFLGWVREKFGTTNPGKATHSSSRGARRPS